MGDKVENRGSSLKGHILLESNSHSYEWYSTTVVTISAEQKRNCKGARN
jgi:hypothetical protein